MSNENSRSIPLPYAFSTRWSKWRFTLWRPGKRHRFLVLDVFLYNCFQWFVFCSILTLCKKQCHFFLLKARLLPLAKGVKQSRNRELSKKLLNSTALSAQDYSNQQWRTRVMDEVGTDSFEWRNKVQNWKRSRDNESKDACSCYLQTSFS